MACPDESALQVVRRVIRFARSRLRKYKSPELQRGWQSCPAGGQGRSSALKGLYQVAGWDLLIPRTVSYQEETSHPKDPS